MFVTNTFLSPVDLCPVVWLQRGVTSHQIPCVVGERLPSPSLLSDYGALRSRFGLFGPAHSIHVGVQVRSKISSSLWICQLTCVWRSIPCCGSGLAWWCYFQASSQNYRLPLLISILEALHQTQDLIDWAPHEQIHDSNMMKDTLTIKDAMPS
jgi:hypothetical protein